MDRKRQKVKENQLRLGLSENVQSTFVWCEVCDSYGSPTVSLVVRMKVVYSLIARTIEDLSDFDYTIEYTTGDRNELADLMSRIPGSERMNKTEVNEVGYLPEGLVGKRKNEGGGDSFFESVLCGLGELKYRLMAREIPIVVNKLTELVINEVLKHPERLG